MSKNKKSHLFVFVLLCFCGLFAGAAHAQGVYTLGSGVFTGVATCDDGERVVVSRADDPNAYWVRFGGAAYLMGQVPTVTGVYRLESAGGRYVWLQIDKKSMLLDAAHGARLLDGCRVYRQRQNESGAGGLAAPSLLD